MDLKTATVLVAHHTAAWIKVAVNSYCRVFSDRVLVVDNNPHAGERGWDSGCESEREWLNTHPRIDVLANPGSHTHAGGLDAAVAWCRQHDVDVMLHMEPDCLVTGPRWRHNLLGAIARGFWMAGVERKRYGPIHATPSAWRISELRCSFEAQERGPDQHHPRFAELVDLEKLKAIAVGENSWSYFDHMWDTAQKAWFEAAVVDRAVLVDAPDFRHYWLGSTQRRFSEPELIATFPELASYV